MKLRNKKTGEIVDLAEGFIRDTYNGSMIQLKPVAISNKQGYIYGSLAELNEEWEDYEKPKEYWFINDLDGKPMKCELRYSPVRDFTEWIEKRKQIGNYFETKEEAEKAVKKLKAWQRLKDKGFRFKDYARKFDGFKRVDGSVFIVAELDDEGVIGMIDDLNICFGGEE